VAIELARCLARGVPFFGKTVVRCSSLLNASESSYGVPQRYQAAFIEESKQPGFDPRAIGCFYNFQPPPDLKTADGLKQYADFIRRRLAQAERQSGNPLRMIILDTFSASFVVQDENSNAEIAAVITICNAIAREFNCAVIVVHHFGKNPSKGGRGGSAFKSNVDFEIDILAEPRTVWIEKVKDGPMKYDLAQFRLEPVALLDVNGELVQSMRVVQMEAPDKGLVEIGDGKHNQIFEDTRAMFGFAERVNYNDFRGEFYDLCPEKDRRDAKKKGFQRAFGAALEAGVCFREADDIVFRKIETPPA
jgi:hypothetical protein